MDVRIMGSDAFGPLALEETSVHYSLVGIAVDYLTRLANGTAPRDAFAVSLMGAAIAGMSGFTQAQAEAEMMVDQMEAGRVDDMDIQRACYLAGFDSVFRAGYYNPDAVTQPDKVTSEHIMIMIKRARKFFEEYGPVLVDGFTFDGAYTELVNAGDGDFLTEDTLWDFKVSVKPPTSRHTLQLLMYYLMGRHSFDADLFEFIEYLGIYNPRLDTVYRIAIDRIPVEVITEVSHDVIGYGKLA